MHSLIADHCYPFDDTNIQDTFISHINHSRYIQWIVKNKRLLPLDSVKLNYSAG